MLPPEQLKGYADIVVSLLGVGGVGAVLLAVIGIKKASTENPPPPAVPSSSMQHLAGMLVGEHFGMQLLERLNGVGENLKALARAQEDNTRAIREAADERRGDARRISEALDGVADRVKECKVVGQHWPP